MTAALLLLGQVLNAPSSLPLAPAAVLQRYAAALRRVKEPHVISFDYTLEQTGLRMLAQTHRVFRAGSDERDETLTVDGKRLTPPKVRVFRGRRNRYTLSLLAPLATDYRFAFAGTRKDGRHVDYIFRLTPKTVRSFRATGLTIDGVRFLPLAIEFSTHSNRGAGSIAFGSNTHWWVPYVATARATVAANVATEKLTFYTYRFPETLPASTFTQARRPVLRAPATAVPPASVPVPAPLRSSAPQVKHAVVPLVRTPSPRSTVVPAAAVPLIRKTPSHVEPPVHTPFPTQLPAEPAPVTPAPLPTPTLP